MQSLPESIINMVCWFISRRQRKLGFRDCMKLDLHKHMQPKHVTTNVS